MPFWTDSTKISTANLERLGPFFDCVVGTEGRVTDLFTAYQTLGARRIVLLPGATLSADLTIQASGTVIWCFDEATNINLGAKKILVNNTAIKVVLAGLRLDGAGGGFEVAASAKVHFIRCAALNCTNDGFYLNGSASDHIFDSCIAQGNGRDGIRLSSGSHARIVNSLITGNTGWGVNDLTNSAIFTGGRIAGNTAGQINGSSLTGTSTVKQT